MNEEQRIKENYNNLKALVDAMNSDYDKYESKKVKAAGARVRNQLLNCKKLCGVLRKQIITEINKIPIKHRTKHEEGKEYEKNPVSSEGEDEKSEILEPEIVEPEIVEPEIIKVGGEKIEIKEITEDEFNKEVKKRRKRKANKPKQTTEKKITK